MSSDTNTVIKLFQKNNGFLLSKDLEKKRNLYNELNQLIENNLVIKIRAGLYKHLEFVKEDEWVEVCQIYPTGVLCLFSAWHYYELVTFIPSEYDLSFPRDIKVKNFDYPPIRKHYWSKSYYELDIKQINGIRIYSIEKSVCDALKFRNKVGKEVTVEVLKNYLKRKDKNLDELLKVAGKMKMENLLREYLEMIV